MRARQLEGITITIDKCLYTITRAPPPEAFRRFQRVSARNGSFKVGGQKRVPERFRITPRKSIFDHLVLIVSYYPTELTMTASCLNVD